MSPRASQTSDASPDPLPPALATLTLATSAETTLAYAELTADFNPIHIDTDFAAQSAFGQPIVHGTMALSLILEAAARTFGPSRRAGDLAIRFVKPVAVGQVLRAGGRLSDPVAGTYAVFVETQAGVRMLEGTLTVAPAP